VRAPDVGEERALEGAEGRALDWALEGAEGRALDWAQMMSCTISHRTSPYNGPGSAHTNYQFDSRYLRRNHPSSTCQCLLERAMERALNWGQTMRCTISHRTSLYSGPLSVHTNCQFDNCCLRRNHPNSTCQPFPTVFSFASQFQRCHGMIWSPLVLPDHCGEVLTTATFLLPPELFLAASEHYAQHAESQSCARGM
jgi:hypothetical protein